tara:strand:+ start:10257 stop:11309 length:1053 start_codon:yes stop_codon:yes gene_type:complete
MPYNPLQTAPEHAEAAGPDFATDLFIADRPGVEFASFGRARIIAPGVGAMLFLPLIGLTGLAYAVAVGPFGLPPVVSGIVLGVLLAAALTLAYANLIRAGTHKTPAWSAFSPQSTDTRYRLRAVIPRSRRTRRLGRWALRVTGLREESLPDPGDPLDPERGGFEPIILRPWLGVTRGRNYHAAVWTTAVVLTAVVLCFAHYSLGSVFDALRGLRAWGVIALVAACSLSVAETLFPVFIRLAPGRLDVFRFGFLGRGRPEVTTHDLRAVGLCVNFQTATLAIEKPRPPGEPLPGLVLSKKWPHHQEHPPGQHPEYLSVALCPGRTEFCQRVIQAARTTEPTPPLPDDQLLG